ncbi:MAG: hypothetical protein R3E97_10525 [Candidatus Eisenbacteria bacterium]
MTVDEREPGAADPSGGTPALIAGLLLPYVAVGAGWTWLHSGVAALVFYQAGIVLLAGTKLPARLKGLGRGAGGRLVWAFAPLVLLVALAFLRILPQLLVPGLDPAAWLESYGLTGGRLLYVAVAFGIVHPFLEEVHYQPLRGRAPVLAHVSYAAYHGMVLWGCFRDWVVGLTVLSLVGTSVLFHVFERGRFGPRLSLAVHAMADMLVAGVALHWAGWI